MIDDVKLPWEEKYRPKTVSNCILPEKTKAIFQGFVDRKDIPNLALFGRAGAGKTTVAKAMCEELGCDYLFINGSNEGRLLETFRISITNFASSVSLSGGRKVIIIDESDGMLPAVFDVLRAGIEQFHKNCSFILTGNYKNKLPAAMLSRFMEVDFSIAKEDKKSIAGLFFKKVCSILDEEKVQYDKQVVVNVITKYFPDNRKVLVELQKYSVNGIIDSGILSGGIQLNELIKPLKEKDYQKVREWVVNNLDNDIDSIYRKIYDGMYSFLKPISIPQVVILIARYQYQTSFVADKEVQLLAFLTELMVESEWL